MKGLNLCLTMSILLSFAAVGTVDEKQDNGNIASIKLTVRYLAMQSKEPDDNVESNTTAVETTFNLNPKETALVLVDTWGGHPVKSHMERTREITRDKIAPVIKAARKAGVTIIYAPSSGIARKYPQWVRYAGDSEFLSPPPIASPDWPPIEFRSREGAHAKRNPIQYSYVGSIRFPCEYPASYDGPYPNWWWIDSIDPAIEPEPEDFVVASGNQLHRLLRDRKILHLIYAGFATNLCVMYNDYGIRAMGDRGYLIVLLRDCTTAIETRESIADLSITKWAIQEIERRYFSATSEDFIQGLWQTW